MWGQVEGEGIHTWRFLLTSQSVQGLYKAYSIVIRFPYSGAYSPLLTSEWKAFIRLALWYRWVSRLCHAGYLLVWFRPHEEMDRNGWFCFNMQRRGYFMTVWQTWPRELLWWDGAVFIILSRPRPVRKTTALRLHSDSDQMLQRPRPLFYGRIFFKAFIRSEWFSFLFVKNNSRDL